MHDHIVSVMVSLFILTMGVVLLIVHAKRKRQVTKGRYQVEYVKGKLEEVMGLVNRADAPSSDDEPTSSAGKDNIH